MAPSLEYSKLLESKKIISTVFRFFLYCLCFRDMDVYATLQSLDFVHALRRLPNVDGQPPSQFTKWWHKRLQEVGGQLHPQTCKEGLPLKWSHIGITKIDHATSSSILFQSIYLFILVFRRPFKAILGLFIYLAAALMTNVCVCSFFDKRHIWLGTTLAKFLFKKDLA